MGNELKELRHSEIKSQVSGFGYEPLLSSH